MADVSRLVAAVLLPAAAAAQASEPPRWSFNAQAYHYFVPDEPDFLLPIAMADRGVLRLEARYNYEDRNTFSAFAGRSWSLGRLTLTPMAGFAVGQTDGIVPGLEVELVAGRLEFWLESEYLFDLAGSEGNFFYAWSELSYRVFPWVGLGLMSQRTKTFRKDSTVDWGLLARAGTGPVSALTYFIDPAGDALFMAGLEVDF